MKNNLGNKETMARNIGWYMAKNNKTRSELCDALNVPYTTLTDWLKAKTYPRIDKIEAMSIYFGISKADLVEEPEYSPSRASSLTAPEQTHIKKYRACDDGGKEMVDRVLDYEYHRTRKLVPMNPPETKTTEADIYTCATAAGLGNYLDNDTCVKMSFPITKIPHGADFGVYVDGDSMEPEIPDGCIVFVKSCPAIEPGEIGVFSLDGDSYCKRLVVDRKKQEIRLESINPEYDPIIIGPDQTLHTFGKVLGWATDEDQI